MSSMFPRCNTFCPIFILECVKVLGCFPKVFVFRKFKYLSSLLVMYVCTFFRLRSEINFWPALELQWEEVPPTSV